VCAVLAWVVVLAGGAGAAEIRPVSYDMPNGNGHATGGSYNYWDLGYRGLGDVRTDNALLTGGLGDLADGVVPTEIWDDVENHEGTGPYVGWLNLDPVIVFRFDGDPLISKVVVHTDDSLGQGGVTPPWAVLVNGVETLVEVEEGRSGAPFAIEIGGLALEGDVTVQLVRRSAWVFVSEVTFEGEARAATSDASVPEPGALGLLLGGVAGLGAVRISGRGRRACASP
jgi:hypothetical protein